MKPPKLLRTVYLRAIKVLEKRGWYQGGFVGGDAKTGPCCIVGACNVAATGNPRETVAHVVDGLSDVTGDFFIGAWNDRKSRRKRQVISALRRAAESAGSRRVLR